MNANIQDLIYIAYICWQNHDLKIVIKTIDSFYQNGATYI